MSEISPSQNKNQKENLKRTGIAYGLANMANGMLSGIALGGAVTFFYNYKFGLSTEYTSLAWLIFMVWNAINDPLFGAVEEKFSRLSVLKYGAPVFSALFILVWYPWGDSQLTLFFCFLLNLIAFDTIYTIIGLVTYSLPAELAMKSDDRATLFVYSTYIGALGVVVSNLFPMLLLTGNKGPTLNAAFRPTMIVLAIISMIVMITSTRYLYENDYARQEEDLGLIEGLKQCLKNKPFLIFEASAFFFVIAQTVLMTGIFYYVDAVLHLSGIGTVIPVVLVMGLAMFMTPLYSKQVKKYGMRKVYIFSVIWAGCGLIMLTFVGKVLWAAYLMLIIIGFGFSGTFVSFQGLFTDSVDYDELLTGKRRETTYAGANALISNKPAISIANSVFLSIIAAYGFPDPVPDGFIATPEIQTGILVGFAFVAGISWIAAGLIMRDFPLDGEKWSQIKMELEHFHTEKEKIFLNWVEKKERGEEVKNPDYSEFDARKIDYSL